MLTNEQIDALDELQEKHGGVVHIKRIVTFLRRGQFDLARNVHRIDGDKTRAYPEIEKFLLDVFGCRSHYKKNCDNQLCSYLYSSNLTRVYPEAWDALPEAYKEDSCLTFFEDVNGNLCCESDLGDEYLWTGTKWVQGK